MDIQNLIDNYTKWLKQEIRFAQFDEYYELTVPYLDRFNDYLQIYVKQNSDGRIFITDDGYIISNLMSSGMKLRTGPGKRRQIERIIRNHGLLNENDSICVYAKPDEFPQKKHSMIQAMLAVDDLYEQGRQQTEDYFIKDVATFFDKKGIFYTKDIALTGRTGSSYVYDFLFQRTKKRQTTFCKTINHMNESKRNLTIFNWLDYKEERDDDSSLIVIYNDENSRGMNENMNAFKNYDIAAYGFLSHQQTVTGILAN